MKDPDCCFSESDIREMIATVRDMRIADGDEALDAVLAELNESIPEAAD